MTTKINGSTLVNEEFLLFNLNDSRIYRIAFLYKRSANSVVYEIISIEAVLKSHVQQQFKVGETNVVDINKIPIYKMSDYYRLFFRAALAIRKQNTLMLKTKALKTYEILRNSDKLLSEEIDYLSIEYPDIFLKAMHENSEAERTGNGLKFHIDLKSTLRKLQILEMVP